MRHFWDRAKVSRRIPFLRFRRPNEGNDSSPKPRGEQGVRCRHLLLGVKDSTLRSGCRSAEESLLPVSGLPPEGARVPTNPFPKGGSREESVRSRKQVDAHKFPACRLTFASLRKIGALPLWGRRSLGAPRETYPAARPFLRPATA